MQVRRVKAKEQSLMLEGARDNIWTSLPIETMKAWWEEDGPYKPNSFFVTDEQENVVGAASWSIYDHYSAEEIVLDLELFYIQENQKRKGLGRQLFCESLVQTRRALESHDLLVVGLFIESTVEGAPFYRKVLGELKFPFSELSRRIGKLNPTVFLADI